MVGVGIEVVVGRDVMECVGDVEREEDVGDDVGVTTLSVPDIKTGSQINPALAVGSTDVGKEIRKFFLVRTW